jgi:hypothetical protein
LIDAKVDGTFQAFIDKQVQLRMAELCFTEIVTPRLRVHVSPET